MQLAMQSDEGVAATAPLKPEQHYADICKLIVNVSPPHPALESLAAEPAHPASI